MLGNQSLFYDVLILLSELLVQLFLPLSVYMRRGSSQTAGNFPIKKYLSRLISCDFDSFTWGITCVQMCWSFAVLFSNIRGVKTCHQIHLPPYFSVVEQSMITLKVAQWPSYITTCHSSLRTKILYFLWMRDAIR